MDIYSLLIMVNTSPLQQLDITCRLSSPVGADRLTVQGGNARVVKVFYVAETDQMLSSSA